MRRRRPAFSASMLIVGLLISMSFGLPATADPKLTVNRNTGEMVYTSSTPRNIVGYSIRSQAGALTQSGWRSITEYYDATATGPNPGLIDSDDSWLKLSVPLSVSDLSEVELNASGPQDGGVLAANVPISFGTGWAKYYAEEVTMELLLNDPQNTVEGVVVEFTGNRGNPFPLGDFSYNGVVGPEDFSIFIDSLFAPVMGSLAQAYAQGDLTGDITVDHQDLVSFRDVYNAANGAGAFQSLLSGNATVPEPQSILPFLLVGLIVAGSQLPRMIGWCGVLGRRFSRVGTVMTVIVVTATAADAQIVYLDAVPNNVDATVNPNPNTTLLGGAPWGATTSTAVDDLYRLRTSTSWGNAGIYETNANGAEDAPMLVTTATGLVPNARYFTYGFFWSNPNENWRLKITHDPTDIDNNGTPANPLDDFLPDIPGISFSANGSATSFNAPTVAASEFVGTVRVGTNPALYKAELGINHANANGELVFYVDDLRDQSSAQFRTWYDGVGYQRVLDLTLQVNTTTGVATLKNLSGDEIDLRYYKITSENSLDEGRWINLDQQNFDAIDGNDAGTIAGDSQLEGWDTAGGSNASLLSEVNFLRSSTLPHNFSATLGQPFLPGVASGVTFEFESQQGVLQGIVEYVVSTPLAGDYDGNGTVETADHALWKLQFGSVGSGLASDGNADGVVDAVDYTVWRNNLGNTAGGTLVGSATPVPEPASALVLATLASLALVLRYRANRFDLQSPNP